MLWFQTHIILNNVPMHCEYAVQRVKKDSRWHEGLSRNTALRNDLRSHTTVAPGPRGSLIDLFPI